MSVRLSPVLAGLGTYPFVRLEQARGRLRAAGVDIIDFGMGEPREETPEFIRTALVAAITPVAPYPTAGGLPELRSAIADWAGRRFGVSLNPDTEVIPTLGSKEAVFALANIFDGDVVAVPTPSYPVYERGAVFAGKQVLELPLIARFDPPGLAFFDCGGVRLMIEVPPDKEFDHPGSVLYFKVTDIDAAVTRAEPCGARQVRRADPSADPALHGQ